MHCPTKHTRRWCSFHSCPLASTCWGNTHSLHSVDLLVAGHVAGHLVLSSMKTICEQTFIKLVWSLHSHMWWTVLTTIVGTSIIFLSLAVGCVLLAAVIGCRGRCWPRSLLAAVVGCRGRWPWSLAVVIMPFARRLMSMIKKQKKQYVSRHSSDWCYLCT